MDLVASYSSDETESDNEGQVVLKNTFKPIESTSNSENVVQHISTNTHTNQSAQPSVSEVTSEKVDYLHLESSDSDEEQPNFQTSVEILLCSAAILSDVECGPVKPGIGLHSTTSKDLFANEDTFLKLPLPIRDHILCNEKRSILKSIAYKETSDDILPRKHFKRDIENDNIYEPNDNIYEPNDNIYEPNDIDEQCVSKDLIFRKDERVTGTCHRKITCRIPTHITRNYIAHSKAINALSWCMSQYSHLLLSASTDGTLKVWDIFSKNPVQCFKTNFGLKAAKWSPNGKQIATGGYGKKSHIFDVPSGKEIIQYDVGNNLTSLEFHPNLEDVVLCGTQNAILVFDLRVNSTQPMKTFTSNCEEVLDIVFLDESEFACSTSVVTHDSADRTIMVWDFSSGALFSNQIFLELYTCPSLKVHPYDSSFVAQTNGDYVAFFSSSRPYKIKNKRCMGHKVSGFGIECDISPDGKYLISGDADGDVYFYNYTSTDLVRRLTAKSGVATNRLKWHPVLFSTIATATWDGHIQIWK